MTFEQREALANRARAVQNYPVNQHIDIVGFLYWKGVSQVEAERHVAFYEARVGGVA